MTEAAGGNGATLAVFDGGQAVFSTAAPQPLQLLVDGDGACLKVHTVPHKAHDFPLTHPGKEGDSEKHLHAGCPGSPAETP